MNPVVRHAERAGRAERVGAERHARVLHNGRRVVSSEMYAILINVGWFCASTDGRLCANSSEDLPDKWRNGISTFSFEMFLFAMCVCVCVFSGFFLFRCRWTVTWIMKNDSFKRDSRHCPFPVVGNRKVVSAPRRTGVIDSVICSSTDWAVTMSESWDHAVLPLVRIYQHKKQWSGCRDCPANWISDERYKYRIVEIKFALYAHDRNGWTLISCLCSLEQRSLCNAEKVQAESKSDHLTVYCCSDQWFNKYLCCSNILCHGFWTALHHLTCMFLDCIRLCSISKWPTNNTDFNLYFRTGQATRCHMFCASATRLLP